MQPYEVEPEDGASLMAELNRAINEIMCIPKAKIGGCGWRNALNLQQQAFARWLRYIDPQHYRG
jgi:hypothetical protein